MIIAGYVRVSTIGQNEESQVAAIKAYCKSQGLEPVWFIDKASGTNLDRPAYEKLDRMIFEGKVATVLVFKLDRISRSLKDGLNVLHRWLESGVRLVSITQGFDFAGTVGKMIAALLLGVAEMEHELRDERQRAGIEIAKQKGVYKGRQPGTVTTNPARVMELRAKGLSYRQIAAVLECSVGTVHKVLKATAGA